MKPMEIIGRDYTRANTSMIYLVLNISLLVIGATIFLSSLYGIQDEIKYHLSFQKSGPVFPDFLNRELEERILLSLEAIKHHFWIFFVVFVRGMLVALLKKGWLIIPSVLLLLIGLSLTIFNYYWGSSLNEFTLLLHIPKWLFGLFALNLVILFLSELLIVPFSLLKKNS